MKKWYTGTASDNTNPPPRAEVRRGTAVWIIKKEHYGTKNYKQGIVKDVLSSTARHPRGAKVRLMGWLDLTRAVADKRLNFDSCVKIQVMDDMPKTEGEFKKKLTSYQYHVMREQGTEPAFTGKYYNSKEEGIYKCAACGNSLFLSDAKFDSGTGWPSFYQPAGEGALEFEKDKSYGMDRTEVRCGRCGSHLGHVFPDGPKPTGLRYCINSACLDLEKKD